MSAKKKQKENIELSVFRVGDITCAVGINNIQEINKSLDITPVQNAPSYIRGMMNLRGNIITIIDMRAKFGVEIKENYDENMRILVVNNKDESIGLLVDKILDVVHASLKAIEPPPSNVQGVAGKYFSSIYKMDENLAAILNTDEVLMIDERR